MNNDVDCDSSPQAKRKARNERRKQEYNGGLLRNNPDIKSLGIPKILDLIQVPCDVDMESFNGTEAELTYAIECLFANSGRDFDPNEIHKMPPSMLSHFGKDWALNAQGIYYRDWHSKSLPETDLLWIPSLEISNDGSSEALEQQRRADSFAKRAKRNETCIKSEFTWEADAWADAFPRLRDDPCLAVDKHEYKTFVAETDECFFRLTGTSSMVCRTPDATFGLATFSDRDAHESFWTNDLHRDKLERLMLHPKYGLISDPKITSIGLSFPFMVYEAKGWKGDYRDARRQACSAAAAYLDLLDNLVRRPGQTDAPRPYQTRRSNKYQVFTLTSFGAYWHLLVGHRRARLTTENAGAGMSESVYIFQRVWSGRITNERNARQLLSLIDQIHNWAITDFRNFVLQHLRPWHQLCDEDYLLEWDLKYPVPLHRKRKRVCNDSGDLMVPRWVAQMPSAIRRYIQERSKISLGAALINASLIKGKYEYRNEGDHPVTCILDSCNLRFDSYAEYVHHLQMSHNLPDRDLAQLRWMFHELKTKEKVRQRAQEAEQRGQFRYMSQIVPPTSDDDYIVSLPKRRKKYTSKTRGSS